MDDVRTSVCILALNRALVRWPLVVLAAYSPSLWAQGNPYTYVKMSLTVPWTLYFVFLAGVLIPFVLLVWLAWRGKPNASAESQGFDAHKSDV